MDQRLTLLVEFESASASPSARSSGSSRCELIDASSLIYIVVNISAAVLQILCISRILFLCMPDTAACAKVGQWIW
jgi:hypothetical protein